MKTRLALFGCVACVTAFSAGSLSGTAKSPGPAAQGGPSIAVVRVIEILQDSAKKQMPELMVERAKARAELEQLAKEIETEEGDLKTSKPGTDDHLKQLERVSDLKGRYQGRREFLEQRVALSQQAWTQKTYTEIVRITREIAAERGFGLVLAADQADLSPSENLAGMIATQKVLYAGGCPDLTDEVRARLGAARP